MHTIPAYPVPLVTIAISTMGSGLAGLVLPPPDPSVRYLVLIQRPERATAFPSSPRADVRYVGLGSVGLSRSRNAALALVDTPIMLLADDDLEFDLAAIRAASEELWDKGAHFAVARFTQGPDRAVRRMWPLDRAPVLGDAGYFASCETFLNVPKVRSLGLAFDPSFGVGSGVYPAAEEAIFLLHAMQAGAEGVFVDHTVAHHEEMSSGYRDLGLAGALGSQRFFQTLRPRRFPVLRRLRFALTRAGWSWLERVRLVCSPSPAVLPPMLDEVHDPRSVVYVGDGGVDVSVLRPVGGA